MPFGGRHDNSPAHPRISPGRPRPGKRRGDGESGGMKLRHIASMVALVATLVPSAATAEVAQTQIQPGARISTPIGSCTTNFVFTNSAGRLFIGTAGHCAEVGDRIESANGTEFGTVVTSENNYPVSDFALILIDTEDEHLVSPAMRYWGGPTGMTSRADVAQGDQILSYGYGIGFGTTEQTRRRAGLLWTYGPQAYSAFIAGTPGDSGGPIVHAASGKALGVIDVLKAGSPQGGTTIENVLARARYIYDDDSIRIVTAPLEPFPQ